MKHKKVQFFNSLGIKPLKLTPILLLGVVVALSISSCSKKEGCTDPTATNYDADADKDDGSCIFITPPSTGQANVNYAFATVGGAWPSQTTYIQGSANLDISNISNINGTELASWGQLWTYEKDLFITRFGAPATLFKYSFDADGIAKEVAQIVIPGANTFSTIEFISATEAYGTVAGGLARVIKFNPQTAQVTGEIDLTPVQRSSVESYWYLGMKARDGKLFMGVEYQNSFVSAYDSAFVAVIDLATSTVEKVISDERTGYVFAAGGAINGFNMDDNGDIYLIGHGTANTPSGVLRIKKGDTDFDASYFMDLDAATGNPCQGLWHLPGAGTFTLRMEDPADPWEFNGPNYKYYKIDLATKTASDIGAPITRGSGTSIMRNFDDTEILFVISNTTEESIYSYNIASGAISKKITADGQVTGFQKLN